MGLVKACLESLPRLKAEESFLMMQRVAMGTGSFPADTQKSVQQQWSEASEPRRARVKTAKTAERGDTTARTERAARAFERMARKHEGSRG